MARVILPKLLNPEDFFTPEININDVLCYCKKIIDMVNLNVKQLSHRLELMKRMRLRDLMSSRFAFNIAVSGALGAPRQSSTITTILD